MTLETSKNFFGSKLLEDSRSKARWQIAQLHFLRFKIRKYQIILFNLLVYNCCSESADLVRIAILEVNFMCK